MLSPKHYIGSLSEQAVLLDLLRRGFNVLMPTVVTRYDLLVETNKGNFIRVQVKTARVDTRDGNLKATWGTPYQPDEVDLLAVYDPASSIIYYIPISDIPTDSKGVTLRVNHYKQKRTTTTALQAENYTNFPTERMIAS